MEEDRLPLWFYTYTLHERIEDEQQWLLESGTGYLFTDDDRACKAREIVDEIVDRNGITEALGDLVVSEYYKQFIWDGEGLNE